VAVGRAFSHWRRGRGESAREDPRKVRGGRNWEGLGRVCLVCDLVTDGDGNIHGDGARGDVSDGGDPFK